VVFSCQKMLAGGLHEREGVFERVRLGVFATQIYQQLAIGDIAVGGLMIEWFLNSDRAQAKPSAVR
jgi:hypothetical protein